MEKEFIARRAKEELPSSDILKIAAEAKEDRAKGNKTIDASIGVFLDEDKVLGKVPVVDASIEEHINDNLGYPPVSGYPIYKEEVLKWLLKDKYDEISRKFHIAFGATLGGTGACFIAFSTFLESGETVLLPEVMWSNYKQIAHQALVKYDTYKFFTDDGHFNFNSLEEKIEEVGKKQSKVLVLINEPCENPTGFCIPDEDYPVLFSLLNKEGRKYNLTVLFDIAYLDYDKRAQNKLHPLFRYSADLNNAFLPAFAFSCSKSFGLYGLRAGALIGFAKDEETEKDIINSLEREARSIYSCPNGPALLCVGEALSNESKRKELTEEIIANEQVLDKRGIMLREELTKEGIRYYPYSQGFFLTVLVNDAFKVAERLKEEHIYVVPLNDRSIRLALSGLTLEEIPVLVRKLQEASKGHE